MHGSATQVSLSMLPNTTLIFARVLLSVCYMCLFQCHISNYRISLFTYFVSEDGSDSYASSLIDESDEEDADHHLLKKPNGDFVHSNDVPLRIGRDDI